MKYQDPIFELEFQALLERGRTIPQVPDNVRSRSLARARVAADRATAYPMEAFPVRRHRGLITALAASLAFVVGAGAAAAAFYARARSVRPATPAEKPTAPTPRTEPPAPSLTVEPQASLPEISLPAKAPHTGHMTGPQESYAAELRLLQRAQAAYADRDFSDALILLGEHRHRFPNGRLTEEREALRVRTLSKSGHTDEAARAAKAFSERFPRSVLLPRLRDEQR